MRVAVSILSVLLPIVLVGCKTVPEVSGTCSDMCEDATRLYGGCLESWGLDWTAAGHEDGASHQESCEVWSWEQSLIFGASKVDALCDQRGALLHDGACTDYTDIDWSEDL